MRWQGPGWEDGAGGPESTGEQGRGSAWEEKWEQTEGEGGAPWGGGEAGLHCPFIPESHSH